MDKLADLLNRKTAHSGPVFARHEFQELGIRLASDLSDLKHKALYIKLSKEEKKDYLLKARDFAVDYPKARSKAKVFMWALTQLKKFGTIKADADC